MQAVQTVGSCMYAQHVGMHAVWLLEVQAQALIG